MRLAEVSAGTSAFYRAAYALPVLLGLSLLPSSRGAWARPARERWLGFAAGVFLAVDLNFWHRSIDHIGAGLATVVANLQVVFVALLAWALQGERPSRAAALAVPAAFLGLLLTTGLGRGDAYGSAPALGAALSVGAALAYTGYLLLLRRTAGGTASPVGPMLDATAGTAAAGLVLALLADPGFRLAPEWPAHGWLLGLALGSHTLGWLLIATALPRLPALDTSMMLLLQPTLTLTWGVLLFMEAPSLLQWVGVALVLASVALVSWHGAASPAARSRRAEEGAAASGTGVDGTDMES